MLRILADENIALAEKLFAPLGRLTTRPGRLINSEDLRDIDGLLVRSVTRVNAELLNNTAVRFVGTATSGVDHVDQDYLNKAGIAFCSAPGSNADAVAGYVMASLAALKDSSRLPSDPVVGIVGAGHVGTALTRKLAACGISFLLHDPPKQALRDPRDFVGVNAVLNADIVSLHIPLHRTGPYATYHWLDEARIARLKPCAVLINTARGDVVDENALYRRLCDGPALSTVWDVWQHEPAISESLLAKTTIATPHVAGFTQEAKRRASLMLYHELCRWLNISTAMNDPTLTAIASPTITKLSDYLHDYDPRVVDQQLRAVPQGIAMGVHFEYVRRQSVRSRVE